MPTLCLRSTVSHVMRSHPARRFRYLADQIVCEVFDERNPQSRRLIGRRQALAEPPHRVAE